MSSTVNATYFGMTKVELNALVIGGEPAEVNGAQAELDRRRANKAAKREARLANPIMTNYEQAFEQDQERDLIEQEQPDFGGATRTMDPIEASEEEVGTVNEPVAN